MLVEGTRVEVTDTAGGVALTFTTQQGDVAELRRRVALMADMYRMHGGHGQMMWRHMRGGSTAMGPMPGQGPHGMMMGAGVGRMPASATRTENVPGGARLVAEPADRESLDDLRLHLRAHQARMQSGECWLLGTAEP